MPHSTVTVETAGRVEAVHRLASSDGISVASTRDAMTTNPSTIRVNVSIPTSTTTAAPGDSGSWDSGWDCDVNG